MQEQASLTKNRLPGFALIAATGLLGMLFVAWPRVAGEKMPDDLVDGRLNAFLLEHFHRWITGCEPLGFWNASFFYPFEWVTTFGDNFLGTGPVYSLLRVAGCGPEDAYRWWFLAGFAANYAASAWVLAKLRLCSLAIATGAFIFTFNMAVTQVTVHNQLLYRCGVPLAIFFFYRALRDARLTDCFWCLFWCVWQFYSSIYTGTFLAMLLAAYGGALFLLNVPRALLADKNPRDLFVTPVIAAWRNAGPLRILLVAAGFAGLAFAMRELLNPYMLASRIYGFQRPWSLVFRMLPRIADYFLATNSRIWPSHGPLFDAIEFKQPLFTGAAVWILSALSLVGILRGCKRDSHDSKWLLLLPLALADLFLFLLTLAVFHHSLYALVFVLPGINALRAIGRIILIMLFPVVVICAFGVDALLEKARAAKTPAALATRVALGLLLATLAAEAVLVTNFSTPKSAWLARIAPMEAALDAMNPPPPAGAILFVPAQPGGLFEHMADELDGMIVAQHHGFATLNGYSGNWPPGIELHYPPDVRILAYYQFHSLPAEPAARSLAARVLVWDGTHFTKPQWFAADGK